MEIIKAYTLTYFIAISFKEKRVRDIAYEMMKEIQVQYIILTTAKAENITGLDQFQDCS